MHFAARLPPPPESGLVNNNVVYVALTLVFEKLQ